MALDPIHRDFGRRVRAARRTKGMSQEALADAVHMSPETISNVERGATTTRLVTIVSIAEALGVDVAALFGDPPAPARDHPLVEEIVGLLAGRDPEILRAVLDQATILIRAASR